MRKFRVYPGIEEGTSTGWRFACSPRRAYPVIGQLLPWAAWGSAATLAFGMLAALGSASAAITDGGSLPIAFIHVPAAWMSAALFVLVTGWAVTGSLLRVELFSMIGEAIVPTGALFALLAVATGLLWGKPAWGTWWGPLLAADLLPLLFYAAILLVRIAIEDARRADGVVALVALGGLASIPGAAAASYSWRTTHAAMLASNAGDSGAMSVALVLVFAGFWLYATAVALKRLRCIILERLRSSEWLSPTTGGPR